MIRSLYERWWTAHFNVNWKVLFGCTYFGFRLSLAYPKTLLVGLGQLRRVIAAVEPDLSCTGFTLHVPIPLVNLALPQANLGSKGNDFLFAPVCIFGELLDQNLILVLIFPQTFLQLAVMAHWVWMLSIFFSPARRLTLIDLVFWVTT